MTYYQASPNLPKLHEFHSGVLTALTLVAPISPTTHTNFAKMPPASAHPKKGIISRPGHFQMHLQRGPGRLCFPGNYLDSNSILSTPWRPSRTWRMQLCKRVRQSHPHFDRPVNIPGQDQNSTRGTSISLVSSPRDRRHPMRSSSLTSWRPGSAAGEIIECSLAKRREKQKVQYRALAS